MARDPELDELGTKIDEAISRMAPMQIVVHPETVKAFCGIVEEPRAVYRDLKEARCAGLEKIPVPESYLLTLFTPLSYELFTTGIGLLLGPVIQGIVHASSVIEFHRPLYCDTPYRLTLGLSELVRKKGKMGEYVVGTFPHKAFDAGNELMAVDKHVFFMRTV